MQTAKKIVCRKHHLDDLSRKWHKTLTVSPMDIQDMLAEAGEVQNGTNSTVPYSHPNLKVLQHNTAPFSSRVWSTSSTEMDWSHRTALFGKDLLCSRTRITTSTIHSPLLCISKSKGREQTSSSRLQTTAWGAEMSSSDIQPAHKKAGPLNAWPPFPSG